MKGLLGDRKGIEFIKMDCTDISLQASVFDVILDKATLDSILCGEGAHERA